MALAMIAGSAKVEQHFSDSDVPAAQMLDTQELRRRIGYYRQDAVFGLDETIDGLRETDGDVRLGVIETDDGFVCLMAHTDALVGLMVLRQPSG